MDINDYDYEDLKVGMTFEFKKILTEKDLDSFGDLTGDLNPLHSDEEYAKSKGFDKRVTYGMLAGSLFSTLLGMVCPGKKNLYLSQTLNFKKPIYPGDKLIVSGEIFNKVDSVRVVTIKTKITSRENIAIEGLAKIKILD